MDACLPLSVFLLLIVLHQADSRKNAIWTLRCSGCAASSTATLTLHAVMKGLDQGGVSASLSLGNLKRKPKGAPLGCKEKKMKHTQRIKRFQIPE